MPPIDQHDLDVAHDLGTLEGKLAAIYENTKSLPDLIAKVERHDAQLKLILWGGGLSITTFFTFILAWIKSHFSAVR